MISSGNNGLDMYGLKYVSDPDADGDGVINDEDFCQLSAESATVDADGCSIAQLCPVDYDWRNRNAYVSCVRRVSNDFAVAGLITRQERSAILSEALRTILGRLAVEKQQSMGIVKMCALLNSRSRAFRLAVDNSVDFQENAWLLNKAESAQLDEL